MTEQAWSLRDILHGPSCSYQNIAFALSYPLTKTILTYSNASPKKFECIIYTMRMRLSPVNLEQG